MGRLRLVPALVVLALVAAACGGKKEAAPPAPSPTEGGGVTAELTEFKIDISQTSLPAGTTTFEVTNAGTQQHEFLIADTDLAPEDLPVKGGEVPETKLDVVDEIEPFDAGTTESLTVDLAAGSYVVICNIPGHYQAGMHIGLTVA